MIMNIDPPDLGMRIQIPIARHTCLVPSCSRHLVPVSYRELHGPDLGGHIRRPPPLAGRQRLKLGDTRGLLQNQSICLAMGGRMDPNSWLFKTVRTLRGDLTSSSLFQLIGRLNCKTHHLVQLGQDLVLGLETPQLGFGSDLNLERNVYI